MEVEWIFRIISIIVGAIAIRKALADIVRGRHGDLREEYKFARDFIHEMNLNPKMHPFLRQKGYQAIAGDARLSAGEIEYLLTLHHPARAIRDYVFGKFYLEHLATATNRQIVFKKKYRSRWKRFSRKILFMGLYLLCFCFAFAPVALPLFNKFSSAQLLTAFVFTAILFLPASFMALIEGIRVTTAEILVRNQQKHSQDLIVA